VGRRVSRKFGEGLKGSTVFVPHQGEDDAVANVGVHVMPESGGRSNGLGPSEVRQGDQYRPEDIMIFLALQQAQEGAETRLGEGAIGNSELPQDVRPHPALDRTEALAEPDRPFQDLVRSSPVQGADGIPSEILIGAAQDDRDQFSHGTRIVLGVGRLACFLRISHD
jgi:hypothetical protein